MNKGQIVLNRKRQQFTAGFGLLHTDLPLLEQRLDWLHEKEQNYYNQLAINRRKLSYLLGRIAAKSALSTLLNSFDPSDILIEPGVFYFPVVKIPSVPNLQVSISHCESIGVALAFPEEHPLGIDIEKIDADKLDIMKNQLAEGEFKLINQSNLPILKASTYFWTIKEALSKVLRTGLTIDFKLLEVKTFQQVEHTFISTFKHHLQYKAISYAFDQYVCSIVLPKNTMPDLKELNGGLRQLRCSLEHV